MTSYPLALILPDIRSAQNVGAMLRTADAAGVAMVITCGYTPHPRTTSDTRPPHIADANTKAIAKTALGAERTMPLIHYDTLSEAIDYLHHNQYTIAALEQAENALSLFSYHAVGRTALVVGNEVDGLPVSILAKADHILELPMVGAKESLNVAVATGIALYHLRFGDSFPKS